MRALVNLLIRWLVVIVAVVVADYLVAGFTITGGVTGVIVVSAVIGLVNAIIRPIAKLVSCGLIAATLGLFIFVINAAMIWLASIIVPQYMQLDGIVAPFAASIVISIVSWIANWFLKDDDKK
jgi:putative membrane protein